MRSAASSSPTLLPLEKTMAPACTTQGRLGMIRSTLVLGGRSWEKMGMGERDASPGKYPKGDQTCQGLSPIRLAEK